MIHGGVLVKTADGRHYSECIGCQEHDDLGDAAYAGYLRVVDVVDRVTHTGVLGQAAVSKIELSRIGVHYDFLNE